MLDIKTLEGWLWDAACKIRDPVDAPKYKDHILPLIFLKRLSDVFDEEIEKLAAQYGDFRPFSCASIACTNLASRDSKRDILHCNNADNV